MTFRSINPATSEVVWEGDEADAMECRAAVGRARDTFPAWSRSHSDDRAEILRRYAEVLKRDSDVLAELIAREMGKPLWEARTEVGSMIGKVALSIAALEERAGDRRTAIEAGEAILRHRPHGVMAVLGPYNFPGHLPNGHIVPALLAGNCVVFKPSEHTPAVGQHLVALLREAGVPSGAIELVQGGRATGAALLECAVNGVLFTGSAAVGRVLRRAFAERPEVVLALELGGNNPLVAWDGDPDAVAQIVVQSAFITTGQRCTCPRRLIVPAGAIGDGLVEALLARTDKLRIGAWNDAEQPFLGPLVGAEAARHAMDAEASLVARGAKRLRWLAGVDGRSAAFVSPGVIEAGEAQLPDDEIFAPLLTVYRAADFPNAIELANRTRFGLAAGLISENDDLWARFLEEARAGVVNRNRPTTGASGAMPFGGLGESGNHRPSARYAADYCAYPVATLASSRVALPASLPGTGR